MALLRRDIVSGLIVVAPVAIVLIVILHLFRVIAGLPLVAMIEPWYARVPVVLIVFVVLVSAVGHGMRSAIGVFVADLITAGINRIPGLRVVYNASHLAMKTAIDEGGNGVEPVKLESWKGLRVNAFDTGNRTDDGRVICFFPTAPNITTGYVIEVEEEHLIRTGESVERALMRILSAGFGDQRDDREAGVPIGDGRTVRRVRGVRIAGDG